MNCISHFRKKSIPTLRANAPFPTFLIFTIIGVQKHFSGGKGLTIVGSFILSIERLIYVKLYIRLRFMARNICNKSYER